MAYALYSGKGVQPDLSAIPLPKHLDAERALVGAVLARNTTFDEVTSIVSDAHFSDPVLARIWRWIAGMMAHNKPASANSLKPNMEAFTKLDPDHPEYLTEEDAERYLRDLSAASSIITMPRVAEGNANIVRDYAIRREIMRTCAEALDTVGAATTDKDSTELARELLDRLGKVEATGATSGGKTLAEAVKGALRITQEAQLGEIGMPTGVLSLDRHIGGLRKSKLYILAARPAMGKSILGFQILRYAASQCYKEGKGVALGISYEMDAEDIVQRYMADLATITIDKQLMQMSPGDHERRMWELERAGEELAQLPMILNDKAPTDIAGLISYVKKVHRENEGGVRVLVVDYLQLMGKSGTGKGEAQREQIVSEISRGLKQISRDLKIPVIALAQLNRAVEQREDKRPKLSDIRECLAGDAMILDADTGKRIPIKSVVEGNLRFNVWATNSRHRLVKKPIIDAWAVGEKPVFKVTTRTGRTIRCTDGHRFLTAAGWLELKHIRAGSPVAVPRRYKATVWSETIKDGGHWDRMPAEVSSHVKILKQKHGFSHAGLGWRDQGKRMSRATAGMLAERLDDEWLADMATSDILWDDIASIEADGTEMVYDITVADLHNFCVDDFVTHNSGSLEQDADCVMFLYREAYYLAQEEPKDGSEWEQWKARLDAVQDESDIIIAKLRQGRPGVVKQHFDGAHFVFSELKTKA